MMRDFWRYYLTMVTTIAAIVLATWALKLYL